jgi:hypothetical protein
MNLLLHPKIAAYLNKNPEQQNRIEKEAAFLERFAELESILEAHKKGQFFFPMYRDMCGFLSLHLLGLNPLNPLAFQVELSPMNEDEGKAETYFGFFTSHDMEQAYPQIECTKLDVLEASYYVSRYHGKSQDELVALLTEQEQYELLFDLIHKDETANQFWFLDAEVRKHLAAKNFLVPMFFNDLVLLIYGAYCETRIGGKPNNLEVSEVYMELFLEGWKRKFVKIG